MKRVLKYIYISIHIVCTILRLELPRSVTGIVTAAELVHDDSVPCSMLVVLRLIFWYHLHKIINCDDHR